jgi:HK97 family phage portal protein
MRFWPSNVFTRKSLATPDDALLAMFGVSTTAAGAAVTPATALQQPAVSSAVRVISEAAASLDVGVISIDEAGAETPDPAHPANQLLRGFANDWTSGFEMIRDLVAEALTRDHGGIAWVNWVEGKPTEMIHYATGTVQVETAATGEPRYRIDGKELPAREIVHVRGPFSRCPVSLAKEAIGVLQVMETHAGRLFGTGAKPGGVIETPKALGDHGVTRMLQGWKLAHEGADKAGKTAVLWDGATWRQMTLNSVDAQFLELRKFQIIEIANAFRVPPSMLFHLDRATWSNSEQMGREFLTYTLEPWLRVLEGAFRRALFTPEERATKAVRFDRDDLTRADLSVRATAINSLRSSEVLSANEGRGWLGLAKREGGDTYNNPNTGTQPKDPANAAQ